MVGDGVGGNGGALQRQDLLLHHDVEHAVVPDLEREVHVLEGVTAQVEGVVADGEGDAVEAGGVGDRVGAGLLVVDGHAHEGLAAGDVADVSADVDLAVAVGGAFTDLIDLVLEGHDGVLLRQIFLQSAVVNQAAAVVEIAGGQRGEDGLAVQDELVWTIGADHVALFAQRGEGGFQEAGPRGADAEGGLLGIVLDIVDVGLELLAQEMHERVQFDALDLEEVLRGEGAGQAGGQQDTEEGSSHREVSLSTSRQHSSNCRRPIRASRSALRSSALRSGKWLSSAFLPLMRVKRPSASRK